MKLVKKYEIPGTRRENGQDITYKGLMIWVDGDGFKSQLLLHCIYQPSGESIHDIEEKTREICREILERPEPKKKYDDEHWWSLVLMMYNQGRELAGKLLDLMDAENFELVG